MLNSVNFLNNFIQPLTNFKASKSIDLIWKKRDLEWIGFRHVVLPDYALSYFDIHEKSGELLTNRIDWEVANTPTKYNRRLKKKLETTNRNSKNFTR